MQVDSLDTLRLLPTSIDVAFVINRTIADKLPHYGDLVPFKSAIEVTVGEVGPWYIYRIEDVTGRGQSSGRYLSASEKEFLNEIQTKLTDLDGLRLHELLGERWVAWNRFTYVGLRIHNQNLGQVMGAEVLKWMNHILLPALDRFNQTRSQKLLPPKLEVDFAKVANAIWVLESEKACRQGTAFFAEGLGLVTCEHVLADDTVAFQPQRAAHRKPITVLRRHAVIDLAVIQIEEVDPVTLPVTASEELSLMDPVAVAGFPNYRVGDSGRFVTGAVSGFRMHSGIRRVLVDAAIVAGNSGGPVLDRRGLVLGVAVTGADNDSAVDQTENHSFVPISAFSLF